MSRALKQRNSLMAAKRQLQKNFVSQIQSEKLSSAQVIERASVFPVSGKSVVLRWPKKS